jgi:hypothetical protein
VVEWFNGYAHHSCTVACMVTNIVGCIATFSGRPVFVAMVTNSSKARFSIGPSQCYIKKVTESRVSLSLRWSVFGVNQSLRSE